MSSSSGYGTKALIEAIEKTLERAGEAEVAERANWERDEKPRWLVLRDLITSANRRGQPITDEMLIEHLGRDRQSYWPTPRQPRPYGAPSTLVVIDRVYGGTREVRIADLKTLHGALKAWTGDLITNRQLRDMGFKGMIAPIFAAANEAKVLS